MILEMEKPSSIFRRVLKQWRVASGCLQLNTILKRILTISGNSYTHALFLHTPSPKEGRQLKRQRVLQSVASIVKERPLKRREAVQSALEARGNDIEGETSRGCGSAGILRRRTESSPQETEDTCLSYRAEVQDGTERIGFMEESNASSRKRCRKWTRYSRVK